MRILVVDDEPEVAKAIAEAVAREGHQVIAAASGEEALELVTRVDPDAVFLDIVMPGMDGIQVLERLREISPGLPVLILSGWASDQQIDRARELGAEIVLKPDILKHLERALGKRRPERP